MTTRRSFMASGSSLAHALPRPRPRCTPFLYLQDTSPFCDWCMVKHCTMPFTCLQSGCAKDRPQIGRERWQSFTNGPWVFTADDAMEQGWFG